MMGFATSGAKALFSGKGLFAALKRCATQRLGCVTQELHAVVESHPSQRTRRMGQPAVVILIISNAWAFAQNAAPTAPASADARPKADTIYIHANLYTGVPATSQFSSILHEEAIAVLGERIEAVGKNVEIEKLKGPQTQVIDLGGHFVM